MLTGDINVFHSSAKIMNPVGPSLNY